MWTNNKNRRGSVVGALLMPGALIVSACGGDASAQDETSDNADAGPSPTDGPDGADPVLDPASGHAETEFGTVEAQRADHSYVGALGDGGAIGIVPLAGIGVEPDDDEQLAVYVYAGDELAVMTGALDDDGLGSFTSGEQADFDALVELTMSEFAMSGTVTFPDAQPVEFTAELADGDAGVYWAEGAADEPDLRCDWVVLPDGSQWGCVCIPPFNGPCCHLHGL